MQSNTKKITFITLFLVTLFISAFVGSRIPIVSAQIPEPAPIPCEETRDNEFHSLRPYQASPCDTSERELALYCANDLLLTDNFSAGRDGSVFPTSDAGSSFAPSCLDQPERGVTLCTFSVPRTKNIAVDLRRAELPIAGNTEDVRNVTNAANAETQPEIIDHNQKINEYLSWYLNGVPYRAEYPYEGLNINCDPSDTNCDRNNNNRADSLERVIDQSGPLRKLLPQNTQNRARFEQLEDAAATLTQDAGIRHNQIVGCTRTTRIPIAFNTPLGPIDLSPNVPFPCNRGNIIIDALFPQETHRLVGDDDYIEWADPNNWPPFEEDYLDEEFITYWRDYREWRGNVCAQTPSLGVIPSMLICVNPPGSPGDTIPDYIAELFPYIPFANTEDSVGNFRLEENPPPVSQGSDPAGNPLRISNERISGEPDSDLYFPHMRGLETLSDLLQRTYVSQDLDRNAPVDPTSTTLVGGEFCNIAQVKTNPGDELFGEEFETELSYTAGFTCEYVLEPRAATSECEDASEECNTVSCNPGDSDCTCTDPLDPNTCTRQSCDTDAQCYPRGYSCGQNWDTAGCDTGYFCAADCDAPDVNACDITTFHTIPAYTDTPNADSVWSRLVAGPVAAFRRIFPQIGSEGPLSEIVDLPASSGLSYSTPDPETEVTAGGVRAGASAELYFPHLGGLHEYFLQCTQKLLRPQGFAPECGDVQNPGVLIGDGGASLSGSSLLDARNGKFPFIVASENRTYLTFNPGATNDSRRILVWDKPDTSPSFPDGSFDAGPGTGQPDWTAGSLGVAPNGNVNLVWYNSSTQAITLRTLSGGSWLAPRTVVSGTFRVFPRVGSTNTQTVVAWSENSRIRYQVVGGGGSGTIGSLTPINAPHLANNQNGALMITLGNGDGNIYAAFWQGNQFSAPELVAAKTGSAYYSDPTSAVGPDGTAHVAWRNGDNGGIFYSQKSPGGSWLPAQRLHTQGAIGTVGVAVDEEGGIHVGWAGSSPAGAYYMYRSASGSWTTPSYVAKTGTSLMGSAKMAATVNGGVPYGHLVVEDWNPGNIPQARYYLFRAGQVVTAPPGGYPTPPPGSACVNLPDAGQYGLPTPQAGGTYGYNALISRIQSEANTRWAVESMLAGEELARSRGFDVKQYLTTAWLWFESGISSRPDPYSVNCNDNGALSNVSTYCGFTNYQIGGYQAAESRKTYRQTAQRIYPGLDNNQLQSILTRVINNSTNASRPTWRYQGGLGLMRYLPDAQTATLGNISENGRALITANERDQFLTLILAKDPAIVAAFNSQAVSDGDLIARLRAYTGSGTCTYGYICAAQEQNLSNLFAALYLYENGCTTAAGTPTPTP